jgi:hypothetical protein
MARWQLLKGRSRNNSAATRTAPGLPMAKQETHPVVLVALALMFAAAYSIARLFAAIASVSALTGVPEYAREIPRIQAAAATWEKLAIVLPFLAALVLGFGKTTSAAIESERAVSLTYPAGSQTKKWTAPIVRYSKRLVISIMGTLGFAFCLFLLGLLLFKLGIRSN